MEGEIKIVLYPHSSEQNPERREVVYSVKKVSAYFLGAIVLNVFGTVINFAFSGKWNWYPAFILACASLITTIISLVISVIEKRALKIYRIYVICHFTGGLLPLGYTLVITLITMHRFWGSVATVFLSGLLLLLVPTLLGEHTKNFTNAFSENRVAGVYNPKTNIWKVSFPFIRKSREQDRKTNILSKAVVPFMYALAVFLNRLLGKYNIFLIFILMFLLYFVSVQLGILPN